MIKEDIKDGEIGLVMIQGDRICQLAMSVDQHKILSTFVASMSNQENFVLMGEEYDLVLKTE